MGSADVVCRCLCRAPFVRVAHAHDKLSCSQQRAVQRAERLGPGARQRPAWEGSAGPAAVPSSAWAACDVRVTQGWGPSLRPAPSPENRQNALAAPTPSPCLSQGPLVTSTARGAEASRAAAPLVGNQAFPGRRPPRAGSLPTPSQEPVLPELAVDAAPRGRVSG